MDLYELFGEDPHAPHHRHAQALVKADDQLIRKLVSMRESAGLTQSDVAKLMGTSQASISRFEAGASDVHLSSIRRYAQAVGAVIEHKVSRFDPTNSEKPEIPPLDELEEWPWQSDTTVSTLVR